MRREIYTSKNIQCEVKSLNYFDTRNNITTKVMDLTLYWQGLMDSHADDVKQDTEISDMPKKKQKTFVWLAENHGCHWR